MIFSHPAAWWTLAAATIYLIASVINFRWKSRLFESLGERETLERLTDPRAGRHQRVKFVFTLLAAVFFSAALAGPRWGEVFEEVNRRGVDVMVAVDTSASMLAEDIKPNRMTQAKRELGLLIQKLSGDRVGVIAFAGSAFLQCPLTLDYGAAISLLELVDTDLIPKPGTNIAAAVDLATDSFNRSEKKFKALVLLTDGEDHSGKLEAAVKRAAEEGVRIFAIGFGRPEGEVIPVRDAAGNIVDYKKDKAGATVVSKIDTAALEDAAARTGGKFYQASSGEIEIDHLAGDIRRMDQKSLESKVHGSLQDKTHWPLAIVFILLILEFFWPESPAAVLALLGRFRLPKTLALILAAAFLSAPAHAQGRRPPVNIDAGTVDFYRRQAEQNPDDAGKQFDYGNALYGNGQFPAAGQAFDRAAAKSGAREQKQQSAYNEGNALFRQQKLEDAVEKYKQALKLDPKDADAKYNLELARRRLQQKEDEQKNKKPQDGKGQAQAQPRDGEGNDEQKRAGAQAQPGEMSKEDAERLLQAVESQEKDAREKMKANQPKDQNVEKDW